MPVTIIFAEQGGGTVQTFHETPFLGVKRRDSHIESWIEAFDEQQTCTETIAKECPA